MTTSTDQCESAYSNIECATPTGVLTAGVSQGDMESGFYTGKGKNLVFNQASTFQQGDAVVIRVKVTDAGGLPVSGASAEITISGPESVVLTTGPSDSSGWAEASWNTKAPKRGQGGTALGNYSVEISNLSSTTHNWDGVMAFIAISIE